MNNILDTFPVLETKQLVLRRLETADAKSLYSYYSNPRVTKHLNWGGPESVEDAETIIQGWNKQFEDKNFIRWAITLKNDNKLIGTVIVQTNDGSNVYGLFTQSITDVIVVGYELAEEYWNRGIMTEALRKVVHFIFNNFNTPRIQAYVEPDNKASRHILKKIKFKEEGLLRSFHYDNVERIYDDVIILALLKTEYLVKKDKYQED